MTDAVTVYCCGTASSSDRWDKFTVPFLKRNTGSFSIILEGPGGGAIRKPNHKKRLPGFRYHTGNRSGKSWLNPTNVFGVVNKIFGHGTRSNVILAMEQLTERYAEKRFCTINLVGWSRGAVTCNMLAHAIQHAIFHGRLGQEVKVNIFAFDPVAGVRSKGGGAFNEFKPNDIKRGTYDPTYHVGDPKKLSPCVEAYHAIVHEHEGRELFVCTIPEQSEACRDYRILPMPGKHSHSCSQVSGWQRQSSAGEVKHANSALGESLVVEFLIKHGTRIALKPGSLVDVSEWYSTIRRGYSYEYGKLPVSAARAQKISHSLQRHPFWLNEHHREITFRLNRRLAFYLDEFHQRGPFIDESDLRVIEAWMQKNRNSELAKLIAYCNMAPAAYREAA